MEQAVIVSLSWLRLPKKKNIYLLEMTQVQIFKYVEAIHRTALFWGIAPHKQKM